jgi:predicted DsbA family dithiol-disulfide isomerase
LAAVMECVAELKADVYYDVLEKAFAARSEWNLQDTTALVDLAANNWVNKSKLQSCVDEWKYRDAVTTMASQWASLFGVSWTPGNVIIDRETGKFVLIPGAYPAESLIEQINAMKAE